MILPIDADEFLVSNNNENSRSILEKLDLSYIHYIKWKTYIPHEQPNSDSFILSKMKFVRNPKIGSYYKVIIPTKLYIENNILVNDGNHDCLMYQKR
ncbi:hypothetical protein ALNOE001_14920 [Candidatus Methanobinarius endosymbioticus]|uniref:Glycosyltransferase 2-like domain-containing protein n=1 Tax=Candidatus Methanobinarius endosymbioticus TaxID=2006182 RepID=A0A366MB88_9EURY|nr:hypothetical protein ALNOE001_14920 [Candidatus Methanobinarius endosymbioticus]